MPDVKTEEDGGAKETMTAEEELAQGYAIDDQGGEFDDQGRDNMTGLMGTAADEDDETGETEVATDDTGGDETPADRKTSAADWSTDLLAEAQDKLGFDEKQAKSFGSPAALQRVLGQFDAKVAELGQTGSEDKSGAGGADKTGAGETKPDDTGDSKGEEAAGEGLVQPFKLDLGEDAAMYPELSEPLGQMARHFNQQVQTLSRRMAAMGEYIAEQQTEAFHKEMDGYFAGLDSAWHDVFGKGGTAELAENSSELEERNRVMQHMDAMAAGLAQIGRDVPDNKTLFLQSVRALHGDKSDKIARLHIAHKLQTREDQATTPPSHREPAPEMDATRRAEKAVASKLEEFGVSEREEQEAAWE